MDAELDALFDGADQTQTQNTDFVLHLVTKAGEEGQSRTRLESAVYEHQASGFKVAFRPVYLVHGTLASGGEPASLVVFKCELVKTGGAQKQRRFRELTVKLRFERDPLENPAADPVILCYAPAQQGNLYLLPTVVKRSEEKELGAAAGGEFSGAKADLHYNQKSQEEWDQLRVALVTADSWKDQTKGGGRKGDNVVEWTVTENEKQKAIPDTFALGVVLGRVGEPNFKVNIDVTAKVDFWYGLEISWQKMKQKFSSSKKREDQVIEFEGEGKTQGIVYNPAIQGTAPDQTDLKALQKFVDGDKLDKLVYLHLPEEVEARKFVNPIQKVTP
jgi:hypothetical protein